MRGLDVISSDSMYYYGRRSLYDDDVEDSAATTIQKTWRGYAVLQIYWTALGSVIQIQGATRGWLIRSRLRNYYRAVATVAASKIHASLRAWIRAHRRRRLEAGVRRAAIKIQSLCRRYLARLNAYERLGAVIFLQCHAREFLVRQKLRRLQMEVNKSTALCNTTTDYKVSMNSTEEAEDQYSYGQLERTNQAARTIQRFFLTIQREVDREIQAAKTRQNIMKNKKKKRERMTKQIWSKMEDDEKEMLENVWRDSAAIRRASKKDGVLARPINGKRPELVAVVKETSNREHHRRKSSCRSSSGLLSSNIMKESNAITNGAERHRMSACMSPRPGRIDCTWPQVKTSTTGTYSLTRR